MAKIKVRMVIDPFNSVGEKALSCARKVKLSQLMVPVDYAMEKLMPNLNGKT